MNIIVFEKTKKIVRKHTTKLSNNGMVPRKIFIKRNKIRKTK